MVSRRDFLSQLSLTAAYAIQPALFPTLSFAAARTDRRLVVVILRGGMDGMAALVPYGDPNYTNVRANLAIAKNSLLRIDSFFGLHPALAPLAELYQNDEMIAIPASATGYRNRSHFDAQNVLELGSNEPNQLRDGWLNRLVSAIDDNDNALAMAVGNSLPLILRGTHPIGSWAPSNLPEIDEDYITLLQKLYANDPQFSDAFNKALDIHNLTDTGSKTQNKAQLTRKSHSAKSFVTLAQLAGQLLDKPEGPRIATLEMGGWDTHANQGTAGGAMAKHLTTFAQGISELKQQMSSSWDKTIVVALSEFGRTAHPNGNGGTDHGTAGTMFVIGGAIRSGRIYHRWPGLESSELYQSRDIRPTIDIRAVIKGLLMDHYALPSGTVHSHIFPDSRHITPIRRLLHS